MATHEQSVNEQFDPQASAYLSSAVHAQGPDLIRAQQLVAGIGPEAELGLDVGCGAGHLSFALAALVPRIICLDASSGMLATVRSAALQKGLQNIETRQASAESLPFPDMHFSLVASRYSAHHWTDLDRAAAEMRRVLRPGGHLLLIDVEAPEDALVDTHLQALELLRDRSHVRDRSEREWARQFQDMGIELLEHRHWPVRLDFTAWVERIRTPPSKVAMLRVLLQEAPEEVSRALAIEADGSFTIRNGLWWGRMPA